jgi:hypothetical protein
MGKYKKMYTDDQRKQFEADLLKKRQDKIRKEFEYLNSADGFTFRTEFIKAQAKEICKYYDRLQFTPFKSWESELRDIITDLDFMDKFYLIINEYGQLVPDIERIESLAIESITPEELARQMLKRK